MQRLVTAVWLVPVWLLVWLPCVAGAVAAAAVVRIDRHALVTIRPAALRALTGAGAVAITVVGAASGSLLIGPAVLLLPSWASFGLMLPLALDLVGVARRATRNGRGIGPHGDAKARAGEEVWLVELYAAHPTGQGHGGQLVDELITHVPAGVWLTTAAASASLAAHFRTRYGFRSWDPDRPLLLERPPTGLPPVVPLVAVPVPQQQQTGQ